MASADPPDAELLDLVARGDEDAFRQIYRRHSAVAYAVALRLRGGDRADADDALQEAWLRAVRGLHGFRRSSTFRTWLVGITIRVALEIGRAREPAGLLADDDTTALPAPPYDVGLDLDRLVQRLPAGYRTVLVLHDIEGHTHDEIAALLNVATGTSKSQLSRARSLMRRWLSASAGSEGKSHKAHG
jgi:RNA polymerase sigma-70 factor (ECF subfamily)